MSAPISAADSAARRSVPADPAEQIAALAAELQQRDQLIEVLTERLEEAAEQLDRLHRSGADRGLRSGGGGGASSELLERLCDVAERTDVMVAEWQEVQAAATLNRIDIKLERLVEILRGETPGGGAPIPAEDNAAHEAPAEAVEHSVEESAAPAAVEEEAPPELQDPPAPVADDVTDPQELLAAVRAREEYISYLIRELNRRRPSQPVDWDALKEIPEEFAARLKILETRLQSDVQREELGLSLERARMARERAELDKIRSRLEKEIRLLGKPHSNGEADDDQGGSLRRLFGKKG